MTDDLALIIEAAREAGELAQVLRRQGLTTEYKAGDNSPVTNADLAADRLLTERLRSARPDYGWLSEETVDDADRLTCRRVFVVDPIDGTRAYLKNHPWWSVSIAVVENDQAVTGVVFAPDLSQMFAAAAGAGATCNGEGLAPSGASKLEDCRMIGNPAMFGHPGWPVPWPAMHVEPRNSTALRLALVAAGEFDATLVPAAKADWDVAAGDLIAREAGCYVGDLRGRPFRYNLEQPSQSGLLCAGPDLATLILDRVRPMAARNG